MAGKHANLSKQLVALCVILIAVDNNIDPLPNWQGDQLVRPIRLDWVTITRDNSESVPIEPKAERHRIAGIQQTEAGRFAVAALEPGRISVLDAPAEKGAAFGRALTEGGNQLPRVTVSGDIFRWWVGVVEEVGPSNFSHLFARSVRPAKLAQHETRKRASRGTHIVLQDVWPLPCSSTYEEGQG